MTYYSAIGAALDDATNVATVALRVAADPALPTVVSLVSEIKGLTTSSGPSTPSTEPGVGLSRIVTPLRAFVAYKKHPWIAPAFIGGAVLSIFALGVMSGRKRAAR
jgi:hypothetical protein